MKRAFFLLGLLFTSLAHASYTVPISVPGVTGVGADGTALMTVATTSGEVKTIQIGLTGGSAALELSCVPNALRIAKLCANVLRLGTPTGIAVFVLTYLADRYIFPSDDGGFVQCQPGQCTPDASGKVKRVQKGYISSTDPGYPSGVPTEDQDMLYFPTDQNSLNYCASTSCSLAYESQITGSSWTCNNGFVYVDGNINWRMFSSCSGDLITGAFGPPGSAPAPVTLPSPDPAQVESGSLPSTEALPPTSDIPLPVDIKPTQPVIDGAPYTDPTTGAQVKERSVVTINPSGSSATVNTSTVPANSPVPAPAPAPQPAPGSTDQCVEFPDSLGCALLDRPSEEDLQTSNPSLSLTPVSMGGSGFCPAPLTATYLGHQVSFSFDPLCTYANSLRPLVLALAWLSAGVIFIGGVRNG